MHRRSAIILRPAFVFAALVAALPVMSSIPIGAMPPRFAITAAPLYIYTVGVLLVFSTWLWAQDRWLGAFSAWVSLTLLWTPQVGAFETVETIVLSACACMILRHMPATHHDLLVTALVVMGLFEVLYGLQQWIGYDMLWHGLTPIQPIAAMFGTTGNSNYYGVYLAMIAPLAPWWAVPFFLLGIVLSHSLLAVTAVSIGLLWRVRENKKLLAFGLSGAFLGVVGIMVLKGSTPLSGVYHRLAVWQLAMDSLTWKGWLIGVGAGSWAAQIPRLQMAVGLYPNEVFLQGHNEWLQLIYESGLIAAGLIVGWLGSHRCAWTGPYGGALLAVLVTTAGMFGLHLAMTGCVALVIVSLALAKEGEA